MSEETKKKTKTKKTKETTKKDKTKDELRDEVIDEIKDKIKEETKEVRETIEEGIKSINTTIPLLKPKGLTITIIFQAGSLNYGEGLGVISTLKKITRGNGETFTYLSRQGLRYEIAAQMDIDNTPISTVGTDKKVLQFSLDSTISNFSEIDLFGYMKTVKSGTSKKRSAPVRISNAISLEPFAADIDFLTNLGLYNRYNSQNNIKLDGGNISQSEKHVSFYTYTVTIDLEKVGIDENDVDDKGNILQISNKEKANRITKLLDTLKFLSRDIKGNREQLMPLFMIGGVYNRKNPFFVDSIRLDNKYNMNLDRITDILDLDDEVKKSTKCSFISGSFNNESDIKTKLSTIPMKTMLEDIKKEVKAYYGVED